MKFGHWTLKKIIKIVASNRRILRLKCTKIDFGWGSAPDPAGGAYSACIFARSWQNCRNALVEYFNDDDPQSLSSGVELGYEQVENDVELPNDDRVLV